MADDNLPGALLTPSQREYLRGGEPLNDAAERMAKGRIRDRLQITFDDLRLLLEAAEEGETVDTDDLDSVLADVPLEGVWPLSALLFLWARQHPTSLDSLGNFLTTGRMGGTLQAELDLVADSFNSRAEEGVRRALEICGSDHVQRGLRNELTVIREEGAAEMTDEELASLPRRTIDGLFERGDINSDRYARVMGLRFGRDDLSEE